MPKRVRLPGEMVSEALASSGASRTRLYDDLAFRYFEACGAEDMMPFQTLTHTASAERRKANLSLLAEVQRLLDQQIDLGHRPIQLPDGELSFVIRDGLVHSEAPDGLVWTMPLSVPTPMWAQLADEQDMPRLWVLDDGKGNDYSRWLSLPELIRIGGFPRMQDTATC